MRNHLLTLLFFCAGIGASVAQVSIFRTYADLTNSTPQVLEGYSLSGMTGSNKDVQLTFTAQDQPERNIACQEIWGFGLDSSLYRIVPGTGMPALVVVIGTPCFYENGGAHLTMFIKETEEEKKQGKYAGFLSDDLNGEMSGVALNGEPGYGGAGVATSKKFLKSRPEYADIIKCLNDHWGYVYLRECVRLHNQEAATPAVAKEEFERPEAIKGEGLEGTWSMTKAGNRKCAGCELFEFRADHTYAWRNSAFSDEGRWRLNEDGKLVLYERKRDGKSEVEDAAPLKVKVKSTNLNLSSGDGTVYKDFERVR